MQGSTVSVVTRLQVENCGIVVCFLAMARDFSLFQSIQSGLPLKGDWVSFFLGVKEQGCECDHSHPPNAEVKNKQSYISAPATCLHDMHTDNFTFVVIYMLHVQNISTVDQLAKILTGRIM
jgi:hypothetical protein